MGRSKFSWKSQKDSKHSHGPIIGYRWYSDFPWVFETSSFFICYWYPHSWEKFRASIHWSFNFSIIEWVVLACFGLLWVNSTTWWPANCVSKLLYWEAGFHFAFEHCALFNYFSTLFGAFHSFIRYICL